LICALCNSTEFTAKYNSVADYEYASYHPIDFVQCKHCSLIFQEPLPNVDEISSFYPDSYRNYLPLGSGIFTLLKKMRFKNQAKKISKLLDDKNSRILEIGYGNGQLLMALKDLGYQDLSGIDFDDKAKSMLESCGIKVSIDNAEKNISFEGNFDYVILNNVIEHFLNPFAVLSNCFDKLNPGAKVILLTPNSSGYDAEIFGKYWAGLHSPRHTFLFNGHNLKLLANKIGFTQVDICSEQDAAQWAISFQNFLQANKIDKSRLKNGLAWYTIFVSVACSPIELLQNLLGNSASLMAIFKK
jgi:SAM-dependent methyltransferase